MRLFLIFILVPVIEIGLFIEIGGWIGTWSTIGLIVLTAFLGSWLMRRQGLAAMTEVQSRLTAGDQPTQLLAEGAMILFAGALLLTPGFFTDAFGLALLLPPVRRWLWGKLESRVKTRVAAQTAAGGWSMHMGGGDTVVDGEFSDVTPSDAVNRPEPPGVDGAKG